MYQYCAWRIKDQHTLKVPCENAILKHVKSYITMFLFKNLKPKTYKTARIHQPWVPCLPFCTNKKDTRRQRTEHIALGKRRRSLYTNSFARLGLSNLMFSKFYGTEDCPGLTPPFSGGYWDVLFLKEFHIDLK